MPQICYPSCLSSTRPYSQVRAYCTNPFQNTLYKEVPFNTVLLILETQAVHSDLLAQLKPLQYCGK